jgi:hypothetical protein
VRARARPLQGHATLPIAVSVPKLIFKMRRQALLTLADLAGATLLRALAFLSYWMMRRIERAVRSSLVTTREERVLESYAGNSTV